MVYRHPSGRALGAFVRTLGPLVLTLVLVLPSTAWADQEAPSGEPPLSVTPDGVDDVILYAAPKLGVPPQKLPSTAVTDPFDIQQLWIGHETAKDFKVGLQVKDPSGDGVQPFNFVNFDLQGARYQIQYPAYHGGGFQGGSPDEAALQRFDEASGRFVHVTMIPHQLDGTTFVFTLHRDNVTNPKRVPVRYGDELTNVSARVHGDYVWLQWLPTGDPTGGGYLEDRAPDAGSGAAYKFQLGRQGQGAVSLFSDDPRRVSNGEATTIVFKVDLRNEADDVVNFQIEATGQRSDWSVRVPAVLTVFPGAQVTFPVIVAVPFTHNHGQDATFEVRAVSLADPTVWASVELGVFWTDIPQPVGHHNQIWLHSAPDPWGSPIDDVLSNVMQPMKTWMNALPTDPNPKASDAPVPAMINNELRELLTNESRPVPSGTAWTTEWWFPLEPSLLIGMDARPEEAGNFHVKIEHALPAQASRVSARLLYCDPGTRAQGSCVRQGDFDALTGWVPLATGQTPQARAVQKDERADYEFPLHVDARADLIPYARGANLGLQIVLTTDLPANAFGGPAPKLVLKWGDDPNDHARLELPLNEYHDPIDQFFQKVGNLRLTKLTDLEKHVNPGKTTVFRVHLNNTGTASDEIQLELHGDARVPLGAGENRVIEIAVQAPTAGRADERAELVLVAQSISDPLVVSALRLRATIVEGDDIPDEANQLSNVEVKGSPGLRLLGLAVALLVGVGLRRRGRPGSEEA